MIQGTPSSLRIRLAWAAGILLILMGLVGGWARVNRGGVDFAVLHAMGVGLAHGVDIYELNEPGQLREEVAGVQYPPGVMGLVVYPPATGFPMLPLALFPFAPAKVLWFLILNGVVLLGIRSLVRLVAPAAPAPAWMIAAGIILLSAAIRWGMALLQGAPLMLGLLCFFIVALHSGRPRVATAIAALAVVFKVTLGLPFLGLLVLHRRITAAAVCGVAWVALNGLGFLRMGANAYATYKRSVADFDSLGAGNINSPDPWALEARPRLDWVSLFYGLGGHLHAARLAAMACSVALALYLLREGWRARPPLELADTAAFLGPLLCLGSLAVYHHHYDMCLFFAPVLIACFRPRALLRPRWALWLTLPLVAVILLLPIGPAQDLAQSIFGLPGVGLLKLMFPVVLTVALGGSLALLHFRGVAGRKPRAGSAGAGPGANPATS